MGISISTAVFVPSIGLDVEALLDFVSSRVDSGSPPGGMWLEAFEHEDAGITAFVIGSHEEWGSPLDGAAQALAAELEQKVFVLHVMFGTDMWIQVAEFDARGETWFMESSEAELALETVDEMTRVLSGLDVEALDSMSLPYWSLMARLPRPYAHDIIEIGIRPALDFDSIAGWMLRERRTLAEPVRERVVDPVLKLPALVPLQPVAIAKKVRRPEPSIDDEPLLSRSLVLGSPRMVTLPKTLLVKVAKLAEKYEVDSAWVLQAALGRLIPWKFPKGALEQCPSRNMIQTQLVMSAELEESVSKTTLSRTDGTPASFDELVRVALTVGLDQFKDELKDDARRRKRLQAKGRGAC